MIKAKNDDTYLNSYSVVVDGHYIGVLNCSKTSKADQVKLKFDNEFIYVGTPIEVIDSAMYVAEAFDLNFMNYTDFELAFDSTTNYLDKALLVYYKSDRCHTQVHEAHGSEPIYRVKGSRRHIQPITDRKISSKGTYTEGSKNSSTQVKIYDKTHELTSNPKPYITEIHRKIFGEGTTVYRVEMAAQSPAFYDNGIFDGIDLTDLLDNGNSLEFFKKMLGEKLVYRSIKPIKYDHNRNPIYEEINLIDLPDTGKRTQLDVLASNRARVHNRNINKFKYLVNGYLDGQFRLKTLLQYIKDSQKGITDSRQKLIEGLELSKRRYGNMVPTGRRNELLKLESYLKGKMGFAQRTVYSLRIWAT